MTSSTNRNKAQPTTEHVDAINELFTKFQLAYHNQFHKAYSDDEQLTLAKQLWLKSLCDIPVDELRQGIQEAIQREKFLPNLPVIREYCEAQLQNLIPDVHSAYIEACQAPSPKAEYSWSHPIVYYAGRESDWFFLANTPENKAFPIFKNNYEQLCKRLLNGEQLALPLVKALPEHSSTPLSTQEKKQRLKALRDEFNI